MTMTPSQKLNEIKRSFNKYLSDNLQGVSINFDDVSFTPPQSGAFLVVRYTDKGHESCGAGGVTSGDAPSKRGRWRHVIADLAAYQRDDPQKAGVADLIDQVANITKSGKVTLYDFSDPEDLVASGTIYIDPIPGHPGPIPADGRITANPSGLNLSNASYSWQSLLLRLSILEEW